MILFINSSTCLYVPSGTKFTSAIISVFVFGSSGSSDIPLTTGCEALSNKLTKSV